MDGVAAFCVNRGYSSNLYFSVIIDLVDLDGQVRNLSGRPREYANEMVSVRETYVLIRVESKYNSISETKYTDKVLLFKSNISCNIY